MTVLLERADFAYGNTRLRARRADLLRAEDYERLLGNDADGRLGALAGTAYARDVEAALARRQGREALEEAVRQHLTRSLRELRSFYAGPARELVDALLSRFDVANLITLLRALLGPTGSRDEALYSLVPLGWPGDALAAEILRQHEPASAVELIVRWLPDSFQSRALWDAYAEYERTGDLAGLEEAVLAEHSERLLSAVESHGSDGEVLLAFLRREIDEHNVLVGLRLRAALERGETPTLDLAGRFRPGGEIVPARLEAALRMPAPEDVATDLAELGLEAWRLPLARWASTGDLVVLADAVDRSRIADAVALFAAGDPLGIDIPLAFMVAKQTEARNLRLLASAAARGLDPVLVRLSLVLLQAGRS